MPTEETAYKGRVATLMKGISEKLSWFPWATALGVGASSGVPDKWFQFGHIPVMHELKKKSAKARKLQEHRLTQLRSMGYVAFCTAAVPESTGLKGQERQDIYKAMLTQLQPEQVDAYILQYASDAKRLRKYLEEQIDGDY